MKAPLYILGFLLRLGPQHGYSLKQRIEEDAADFAQIKTSNIYYHLERLKKDGYVISTTQSGGKRPDRQVFEITPAGEKRFFKLLHRAAGDGFRGEFLFDAALFFFEYIDTERLRHALQKHIEACRTILNHMEAHQHEIGRKIPKEFILPARSIFNHHTLHFKAELKWLRETLSSLVEK